MVSGTSQPPQNEAETIPTVSETSPDESVSTEIYDVPAFDINVQANETINTAGIVGDPLQIFKTMSTTPTPGDPSHVFVGTDSSGDKWKVWDGNRWVQWSVLPGDDSRNVISGSIVSSGTTPPPPNSTAPAANAAAVAYVVGDSSHRYQGSSNGMDFYQTTDSAGNIVNWAVKMGDDSRKPLPGSVSVVQKTSTAATSTTSATSTTATNAAAVAYVVGDSSHRYQGSSNGMDFYQTTDSAGNIVNWAVKMGEDSRKPLPGSVSVVQKTSTSTNANTGNSGAVPGGTGGGGVNGSVNGSTTNGTTSSGSLDGSTVNGAVNTRQYIGVNVLGDAYGLVDDAGTFVAWTVKKGDDSAAVIPGTLKNYAGGKSATNISAYLSAINTDFASGKPPVDTGTPSTSTTTASTDGKAALFVTLGVVALKAFVLS